jgi:dTDP-4-dehydrorhamnose 3,5-epimerase
MNVEETNIEGLYVLSPKLFKDDRGYFYESFNKKLFEKMGINSDFVQDNESYSQKGTIRGLHFQKGVHAQAKLVRCSKGVVFDVAVDLRVGSSTFGKWYGVILSGENKKQFYVPRGFAHGFSVLSDVAIFNYKCDNFYNKESESGLFYGDPLLGIDWKVDTPIVSDKDRVLSCISNLDSEDFFHSELPRDSVNKPEAQKSGALI